MTEQVYQNKETWNELWKNFYFSTDTNTQLVLNQVIINKLDKCLKKFDKNKKISYLEVGSGSGFSSQYICDKYGFECNLLDLSEESFVVAKEISKNFNKSPNYIVENILSVPESFYNNFDVVVSIGLNEHFDNDDRRKVFDNMRNLVKEGGIVIVVVPNFNSVFYRLYKKRLEKLGVWNYGFEKGFTLKELSKLSGLKNNKFGGFGFFSSIILYFNSFKSKNNGEVDSSRTKVKSSFVRKVFNYFDSLHFLNKYLGHYILIYGEKN